MGAAEQVVAPSHSYRSYAVLYGIVINVEHSIGGIKA